MPAARPSTVAEYLESLPPDRREVVSKVRDVVRKNLPKGYEETISFGMIGYGIPLSRYSKTYNGEPLSYAAIAAQKNHYSVYLMCVYGDDAETKWLAEEFRKAGKKLDLGKSCLRFKKLEDLPLDVLGKAIAKTPPEKYIEKYEASRKR
jgi:uncharacterized protein YdhG (YjbR/CyaY superfamily)